ncbi:uncharacterized protein PGTG_19672 [Puccinia graminis f. sp. tritici CRL 75-36-700-3]|uniref:Uncharacterized protein n=1 Tax=Puccinia graminis f. sp. tritici (strain CRL 75-36-700-3 / race SCCL) TaxID=418459 RepID=E3LAX8_PUCGT|nr:uncharacterized protein PGTG_19672 [Puccinia graminis f. sp. tritici CRL 75-36-700-3]EFP93703.2 hypothetical protein PGTG_19672 [Puccinia graminis f. sp. tritici CRL 75-36-700-3]
MASSTRTQNKHLAPILPTFNSPVCQALYNFIRLLLGIDQPSDPWPSSPSSEHLSLFRSWRGDPLDEGQLLAILEKERLNNTLPLYGKKKALHESNRLAFLKHLANIQFPHPCFNWNEPSSSAWNAAFSRLILRHWNCGRLAGSFLAYPMDPNAAGKPSTILGLINRWFNGRRDSMLKEERKPGSLEAQKKLCKRSRWRKTLAKHRTDTLEKLQVPEKFRGIFEDPLCNSDTESLEDGTLVKVQLEWRSELASSLAARVDQLTIRRKIEDNRRAFGSGQLLETCRQNSTKNNQPRRKTKVPRAKAVDFYDDRFLEGLEEQSRYQICAESPLGLSDLWFHLDKSLGPSQ